MRLPQRRREARFGRRRGEVPSRVHRLVLRGLQADPATRFPSMDALLAELACRPGRFRRHLVIAAAALALSAAGAIVTHRYVAQRSMICKGAEQKLAGVWDTERKLTIQSSFLKTGMPYAADAWRNTSAALDRYA